MQAKLEVGPAHDRYEAEADRVAASVSAMADGASGAPPISPLVTAHPAQRKHLQREEQRPIDTREEKSSDEPDLTGLGALVQRKADSRQDDKEEIRTKRIDGTLQRESDIDDDTVAETTIQTKRYAALQRDIAKVDGELETEEPQQAQIEEPAQREANSTAPVSAPASVESGIASMRGRGEPLAPDVRGHMEPRFGRDLSAVRIHRGARAGELAGAVHSHAFTLGSDIFFGHSKYQPHTHSGRRLLAHELTHTIQQGGGSTRAQPARIQRASTHEAENTSEIAAMGAEGGIKPFQHKLGELQVDEKGNHKVIMKALPLPNLEEGGWKGSSGSAAANKPAISDSIPWHCKGKTKRGGASARQQWLTELKGSASTIASEIGKMAEESKTTINVNGKKVVYLESRSGKGALNFLLIGTPDELANTPEILIPIWNRAGTAELFDVDHIHELQLGGKDGFPNFWLLDQGSNRSSGSSIAKQMRNEFNEVVRAAEGENWFGEKDGGIARPEWSLVKDEATNSGYLWQVQYRTFRKLGIRGSEQHWRTEEVKKGDHLKQLKALSDGQIMKRGLIYARNPDNVQARIYALMTGRGGFFRTVNYKDPAKVRTVDGLSGDQFYKGLAVGNGGFRMETMEAPAGGGGEAKALLGSSDSLKDGDVIASIRGQPFPASGKITAGELTIPIRWAEQLGFGGYADTGWINEKLARLSIAGASPIEIYEAGITPQGELFANGEIVATKALFPNYRIPIGLRGNEIFVQFPISAEILDLDPVHISESAIEIGYGEHGLFLGGYANVNIDHVGSGLIEARTDRSDTIVSGDFNFDLDFLQPANAKLAYRMSDDSVSLELKAGVREGGLPGVASGEVTAKFSREAVSLTGSLTLAKPFEGAEITLGYTPETGITIAAENVPLPVGNIPGIESATLGVAANYNPDLDSWHLSGEGKAKFAIPPVTGDIDIAINGRAMTFSGTVLFSQGPVSGTIMVTSTNRPLDEQGQPVEGEVADSFKTFGKGLATLRFGILTGSAAIEISPDERIIVSGEIGFPDNFEIFERRSYEKPLLRVPTIDFPIWGISIAGYGVGIFAFIDPRIDFDAHVGPGTLQNTKIKAQLDIAKPEDAVIDGNAEFVVPAGAGITLDIGGGLRARLAMAFAQGRVGLDARLGIETSARAAASFHWSKDEGLSLKANASAEAHPRFEIGANASVTVGIDLGLWEPSKTWGPWRKELGSFGPGMSVGVTMPIAWSERGGLDFNVDDVAIQRPEIDYARLMKDSFLELV